MTEALVVGVLGLLAIAATTSLADRIGLAAPLLLVAFGIVVSLVPGVPTVVVDPEWILVGVLPPLLYASAVAMPSMDFRREFAAISGLSVLLVLLSAGVVGLVLNLAVPGLGLAAGIALGAIVSPTDAVATSIVRRVGVTPRVVTVLEGESLLNDATALVVLRAGVAAGAAAVSVGAVALDFAVSVVVAVVVGFVVGKAALWVRSRVRDATVSTVLSFATPFVASVPVEQLHASGLVAAVVAGLVTGQGALANLPPRHRIADAQNWRTVAFVLEGGIFLLMGLELTAVVGGLKAEADGAVGLGLGLAAVVLVLVLLVRVGYVMPLIALQRANAHRSAGIRPALSSMDEQLDGGTLEYRGRTRKLDDPGRIAQFRTRLRRKIADIDHLLAEPLGPRDGAVVVWAGARGAVTLAAAQTLPETTPHRPLLVFVAFCVAAGSLLLQGGTLPLLVRWVKPTRADAGDTAEERDRLVGRLLAANREVLDRHLDDPAMRAFRERLEQIEKPEPDPRAQERVRVRMEMIEAQRAVLLAAREEGTFSSQLLTSLLDTLDAEQISIELRAESA